MRVRDACCYVVVCVNVVTLDDDDDWNRITSFLTDGREREGERALEDG